MNALRLAGQSACVVCLLIAAAGCAISSDRARGNPDIPDDTDGAHSIQFDRQGTLTLTPRELTTLTVIAKPAAQYRVRFALLQDETENPIDASLDKTEAITDGEGLASLRLRAPTSSSTFRIRASIGTSVKAELPVSISEAGFGTLLVDPNYTGKRALTGWLASVRASGMKCADLSGVPPPDGDLVASGPAGSKPAIELVPVGAPLTVTLRSGYSVGGCIDMPGLPTSGTHSVLVPVVDRPIQLQETDLQVVLGVLQPTLAWNEALDAAIEESVATIRGSAADDASALLDAMQFGANAESANFEAARWEHNWDGIVRSLFGVEAGAAIRTQAALWMVAGAGKLVQADTFSGRLKQSSAGAQFELERVAQLDAVSAGFSRSMPANWAADPGDTVLLGMSLNWLPSRLVVALADQQASLEYPGTRTGGEALARFLSCERIASGLVDQVSGEGYPGCGAVCLATLCSDAVGVLWQRAREAPVTTPAALQISATGGAKVDELARPVAFEGSWVGSFRDRAAVSVGGSVRGALPNPPN